MAFPCEILIKDQDGNVLKGSSHRDNGASLIFEFSHKIYLPYESDNNRIQGSRQITAFEIVKIIDRLTPQLYQIVCTGQICKEIKITLYTISPETRAEEPYFIFTLKNTKIVSVSNWMYTSFDPKYESYGHMEKVEMLAREFTWDYLPDGVIYTEQAL